MQSPYPKRVRNIVKRVGGRGLPRPGRREMGLHGRRAAGPHLGAFRPPKLEIRISKSETNSKHEAQRTQTLTGVDGGRLGFWALVIWICFGFRASCFGFATPDAPILPSSQAVVSTTSVLAAAVGGRARSENDGFIELPNPVACFAAGVLRRHHARHQFFPLPAAVPPAPADVAGRLRFT